MAGEANAGITFGFTPTNTPMKVLQGSASNLSPQQQVIQDYNVAKEKAFTAANLQSGPTVAKSGGASPKKKVYGKAGRNFPADTRMAEVLLALGIEEELMKAAIAAGQLHTSQTRLR